MSLDTRVLDGLGPALRTQAGPALEELVEALVSGMDHADQLVQKAPGGWAAAFDATHTPDPVWLGVATGTAIPAGLTIEEQRDLLRTRPGWRTGTVEAMKAASRTVLVGFTKRVDVLERVGGDPYLFGLRVWASELPGGDTAPLIAAALTQKPVGLLTDVDVEIVDHDATFAHMTEVHGTFADLAEAFPTLGDMTPHVPEEGTSF